MSISRDKRSAPVHALVVDQRRLVREGVCALLQALPGLSVASASHVDDPVDADVLVLGQAAATDRATAHPAVVRLAEFADMNRLAEAVLAAGSDGALTPTAGPGSAPAGPDRLTARQRDVIDLVSQGRSASEIADELGISAHTVRRHKQRLLATVSATNQANAVARTFLQGELGAG